MAEVNRLEDRIGEIVREVTFPVEGGKVAEFARAMRDPNPIYLDAGAARAAGFASVPAPLTFSVASTLYAGGNATDLPIRLGLDLSRTVHGEQRWEYHAPLEVGAIVSGTTRIAEVDRKESRGGEMLRVLTETKYCDANGKTIVSEGMLTIELPKK
ncbi:MAG: MaoC family dehydratase N-terminal domain-containing protein [Sphingomonadales bacterium]